MCFLPKIQFAPAHARLGQKGNFEANFAQISPKLGPFLPKNVRNCNRTSHTQIGRTHAHRTHALEAFSHAHRTCADVRAPVRVRIQFCNSQFADNYVLQSTKTVLKPAVANERRSRSLSVTSKRLHKAKAKAESPSITTFLKPRVASSDGIKNDVGEPKEALIKSQLDRLVSQKLISAFFPKNKSAP